MKFQFVALAFVAVLFAGCAAMPGDREGATPPKLVTTGEGAAWDNPGAFGPVPAAKAAAGAKVCETLNTKDAKYVAKGYHSKALDLNGKTFADGGYYCMRG